MQPLTFYTFIIQLTNMARWQVLNFFKMFVSSCSSACIFMFCCCPVALTEDPVWGLLCCCGNRGSREAAVESNPGSHQGDARPTWRPAGGGHEGPCFSVPSSRVCDVVCGEKICSAPSWNSLCQKMLCCLAGLMNSVSALHPSIGRICSITGTHVSLDTLCSSSPVSNTEVLNHFR